MAEAHGHAPIFESLERQEQAARLGMWVFLASELLLFGALFALYAAYRARAPAAFHEAVGQNSLYLGSLNTVVLIVSSFCVANAVHQLRHGRSRSAVWLVLATVSLGSLFLGIKGVEYAAHFGHGIFPGKQAFWTLYFMLTGLHAVHVVVGVTLLSVMALLIRARIVAKAHSHKLELAALYWHLVDAIWIFLWPLFYLTRGGGT